MPDLAGPFDASTFAQAQYYRDRGFWEPSGVRGVGAASAAAGDLGLTAAGFALTMGLGRARVRGAAYERTGSAFTYTVPANTSSSGPRNDLLVLRRDLTAKTVVPTYVQGVAAATPVDPAVTQVEDGVWDEVLFRVQAPASSGTPLVITDLRRWLDGTVHRIRRLPLVSGGVWTHYNDTGGGGYEPVYLSAVGLEVRIRGLMRVQGNVAVNDGYTIVAVGGIPPELRPVGRTLRSITCLGTTLNPERCDVLPDGSVTVNFTRAYTAPWLASFDISYPIPNSPTAL